MDPLKNWLEAHKDKLVRAAVQEMTERETLREQAILPVTAFYESLIQAVEPGQQEALQAVLRRWVAATTPTKGEPAGLLPVLSVIKRTIWREYLADPPAQEALSLAMRLDSLISTAVEILVQLEADALWNAAQHTLAQRAITRTEDEAVQEGFVSVAAHELKTPLTVIEGYANMLRLELTDKTNPRGALMVRGIQTGIERLRQLIDDLIDVSLIEMRLLQLEFQPVWLRRVLDIAEFELNAALNQRRLTLEVQRDTIVARPTLGDPTRLLQAIQKILANAVKYTPDGGRIVVSGRDLDEFMEIVIEDTGIGIEPENLERIFEKFSVLGDITHHSSGKTKFKGGGAGLGLVIAQGIIEAHGGMLWAESPGMDETTYPGSRFHILLPMKSVTTGEGISPLVAAAMSSLAEKQTQEARAVNTVSVPTPEPTVAVRNFVADRSGEEINDVLSGETVASAVIPNTQPAGEVSTQPPQKSSESEGG